MNVLGIIELVLSLLTGALTSIKGTTGTAGSIEKVASEVQAAIDALARAHSQIVTLAELESLRTQPKW